ncbi:helix-turn-helix transcriptional regulator [Micromonospora sp. NBC_00421]|uniref:helix-turn-helix transcriptional regulator n=1 Tax=Micromonospora sp. NBC_00421 TaxID=2975976 RepID=UPI002E20375C
MTSQSTRPEPTTFVGADAARARIARPRLRRRAAQRADAIRAEMAEADRLYAENLAAIRKAADLAQVEPAKAMGVAQSEISRVESRLTCCSQRLPAISPPQAIGHASSPPSPGTTSK